MTPAILSTSTGDNSASPFSQRQIRDALMPVSRPRRVCVNAARRRYKARSFKFTNHPRRDLMDHYTQNFLLCLVRKQGTKGDRKSTRLNSSHRCISYAVFCLKKKKH